MVDMLTPPPLSLYVHLPWFVRKCPYCDFNSHEFRGAGGTPPFTQYVEALLADLDHALPLAWGRPGPIVFFGGGTPSLFPAEATHAFLPRATPPSPSHPPLLSLHDHLPWCVRNGPYCDFNSNEFRGAGGTPPFTQYVEALLADLDHDLPLAWGRTVHSVFFGGGTPSLFPAEAIDAFLQGASARLRFAPGLEVTLAPNPGTAEHGRFEH